MVSHFSQPGTFTNHRVESPIPFGDVNLSSEVAAVAASPWNNADNKLLNDLKVAKSFPASFGTLEITGITREAAPNPNALVFVEAELNRQNGQLKVKNMDTGRTVKIEIFSGDEKHGIGRRNGRTTDAGANGQFDNLEDLGPLPKGEYLIGMPERNEKFHKLRPDGDNIWYPLYRVGGSNNSRSGFYIHAGKVSHGCLTIESEVPMSSAQYPHSREYTKLRRELDNTTPFSGETPPKTRQYQLLNPPDLSKRLYIGKLTVN